MRAYTHDWYLQYLRQHDTPEFRAQITAFAENVGLEIKNKYKTRQCQFIETLHRYEDFWMITSYDLHRQEPLQIQILRGTPGNYIRTFYSRKWNNWGGGLDRDWSYGQFNYSFGCSLRRIKKYLYPDNLDELFKGTVYQYSCLAGLARNITVNLYHYMVYSFREIHIVECLTKLGCYRLASDIVDGRYGCRIDEKNIIKSLSLKNHAMLETLIKYDFGSSDLHAYKRMLSQKVGIEYFGKLKGYFKMHSKLPSHSHITNKAFLNYYLDQTSKKLYKHALSSFVNDYRDYIGACRELKYDINNTMYSKPHNFQRMHDETLARVETIRNKGKNTKYRARLKKLLHYEFVKDSLQLVLPKTIGELVAEGKNLGHCVGTYTDRILSGNCVILFVRQAVNPAESFYTLELNPKTNTVVQCRGKGNKEAPPDIKNLVNTWQKRLTTLAAS